MEKTRSLKDLAVYLSGQIRILYQFKLYLNILLIFVQKPIWIGFNQLNKNKITFYLVVDFEANRVFSFYLLKEQSKLKQKK